jgi:hypothetical protein
MLTWIRNLLGIRKDVADFEKVKIDTLKAELEVDKLEDEASERNLLTRATMDDVKKYDPKYTKLEARIKGERIKRRRRESLMLARVSPLQTILTLLVTLFLLIYGLTKLINWILKP